MPTIKHILFPCDFSEQCSLGVPFVRAIASRFDARITLLNVIPPVWAEAPAALSAQAELDTRELPIEPQARLETMLAQEFAGLAVQSVTGSGDPAVSIVDFAHDHAVDLIMIPTHGYELFRSLVIGSVTSKVLHEARCPVWTATHAEEQQSPGMPRTILCAVDGTPKSLALLQWASGFSQQMGAALKLIHVAPRISDALALPSEKKLQEEVNQQARAGLEALVRSAGVEAPLRITAGAIADAVAEAAEEEDADLVLVGRGSLQAALGRLRTHTYGIIQKSPCPVLSV
jgi:nucleotide-binding universal stress UspA family protein